MHNVVLWATKVNVQKSYFIFVSRDEVTTINNQSLLSIHVYVTEKWKRVPILLNLQCVVDGAIFLVYFGANGITVSQGVKNGVIAQIMQKHAPFVSGVRCMAHHTNLSI
jgi:hypothetical protein